MAEFRKRPVVVEAMRVREVLELDATRWEQLPLWVREAYYSKEEGTGLVLYPRKLYIYTLEGAILGNYDDWLIRGTQGEIYCCNDDIFRASYEEL